ncbi:hypothetical protein COV15_01125 [Candidatus Woesearchaeota archaeon CG10_big_fil_rev_8_21_14_0_10_34_12]|nr:MAG: hypothetical protein COV15_01125 [Candidatus Woesearchaeota archaeon CG10_big_fil_rev_8_21_14_0_10_34_12]
MYVKERTKEEIEQKILSMSDLIQIEYLESAVRVLGESVDTRRFVHEKLSELYFKRGMLKEAARHMASAALFCATYREITRVKIREAELHIAAGDYESADSAFRQAGANSNKQEKEKLLELRKILYFKQALEHEKNVRNSHALKIYERMYSEDRSSELKEKLKGLYQRLGKIQEFRQLG